MGSPCKAFERRKTVWSNRQTLGGRAFLAPPGGAVRMRRSREEPRPFRWCRVDRVCSWARGQDLHSWVTLLRLANMVQSSLEGTYWNHARGPSCTALSQRAVLPWISLWALAVSIRQNGVAFAHSAFICSWRPDSHCLPGAAPAAMKQEGLLGPLSCWDGELVQLLGRL